MTWFLYAWLAAGWVEWCLMVAAMFVYANALWCLRKNDPGMIFGQIVGILYLVTALELYRLWFLVYRFAMGPLVGMARESMVAIFTVRSFGILLCALVSLGLLVLVTAIQQRPRRLAPPPTLFVGVIAALSAVMFLHLFYLGNVYARAWQAAQHRSGVGLQYQNNRKWLEIWWDNGSIQKVLWWDEACARHELGPPVERQAEPTNAPYSQPAP